MIKANTRESMQAHKQRIFRKSLIIPTEHGSWSWLLVPYAVGVGVAAANQGADAFNPAQLLLLVGALSAFLMRQPATVWLRIQQGRGRRTDEALAAGWTISLGLLALTSLAGLLALGHNAILWLLLPLSLIFLLYLAVARIGRARVRSLWMEMAGALGLAAAAPAAYLAASRHLEAEVWLLWGLMALQNALGVLYVRLRIADSHGREMNRVAIFAGHLLALLLVGAAVLAGRAPWLVLLPFVAFLLRAAWAVVAPRPIEHIKRFGFTEVGVEAASGLCIIVAYLLADGVL